MPRTYKPKPGTRLRARYDPINLAKATRAKVKGMSYRKISEKFGIPKSVLHRRITKPETKEIGGPTALSSEVEDILVNNLITCGNWGYPLTAMDLRLLVKDYFDRKGEKHPKFKTNMPGKEWTRCILSPNKSELAQRMCQNIKRSRAAIVSPAIINEYFNQLEETVKDVPPENIVNYDETNLTDDPGAKRVIVRRGMKYPERVMNSTKSSTSLMFAGTTSGVLLPPYIVYKATNLYDTWTEGGPTGARYNRSKSGWFDSICFPDWFFKIALPYLRRLEGKKVLIGDNLSSHLSLEVIAKCEKHNINFVFLPANSSHMTQPLDVAFFRPMKVAWRQILEIWKSGNGKRQTSIPKDQFPKLLAQLSEKLYENQEHNLKSGFSKSGIYPISRSKVLSRLPHEAEDVQLAQEGINESLTSLLKEMRYESPLLKSRKKKLNVPAGKSVAVTDLNSECNQSSEPDKDSSPEADEESGPESSESEQEQLDEHGQSQVKPGLVKVRNAKELKKGKWVVVNFGELFIGKIVRIVGKSSFEGIFLREAYRGNGSTFSFPEIEDRSVFDFDQIVTLAGDPEETRRGALVFGINIKKIK